MENFEKYYSMLRSYIEIFADSFVKDIHMGNIFNMVISSFTSK